MIGNIVEIGGEPQQLRQIARLKVGYCPLGSPNRRYAHVSEIKPIPITEELLLKNGFERYDKHSFHLIVKPCYTLYLVKPKDSQPWYCKVYGIGPDDNYSINALYLHQYQNLCNIAGVEMEWKV